MIKKKKTKKFPFCPENKVIPRDNFNNYMKKTKPMNYTKTKTLICSWNDKKNI